MGTASSTHGAKRDEYRILVGKLEGKRQLTRRRREDNIKKYIRDIE
jgi:hypothetical protein